MKTGRIIFSLFAFFLTSFALQAQGSLEEYRKSVEVETLYNDKVYNAPTRFQAIDDKLFWYVNPTRTGKEYMLVDAPTREQQPAFDHASLASSLSELLGKSVKPGNIRIDSLSYNADRSEFRFNLDSIKIACDLTNYQLKVLGEVKEKEVDWGIWAEDFDERKKQNIDSPDCAYTAFVKNSNVYVRNNSTDEETRLSYDGSEGNFYSSYLEWSPDSKKLLAYKVLPGQEHKVYYIESSPEDQLQPKLHSQDYLKPGDQLPFKSPQLFLIETREHISIPTDLFQHQYLLSRFEWRDDSSAFTFEYNQRGHQVYRVLKADAATGKVTAIVEETSPTFFDYYGKKFRHDLKNGDIVWMSERDGWNHLYLFDGNSGKVKKQLTSGNWPVREVLEVDEENRHIYFAASGMDKDQDPYFKQYFRIDLDGKNLLRLTHENGDHRISFSADKKFYIDQYSRVDLPPVSLLKQVGKKEPLMQLQKADIEELLATGWNAPEVFTAKGRDGRTDIWGIIMRPRDFDPRRSYPIIEYIYAGPHDSFVPKDFSAFYTGMSSLAELGFIVVKIDGMGTSNRSKAFHDVAWKNLKDAGFPDRKLWITAAAEKYPYMNTEKVGIHGRSAGGQSSSGALLFHPEFYDVAVSSVGCHDNRMDKIWWNELWMGYPVGPQYAESSNIEHAANLQGNLMLLVGELDHNVDPASTFQFADALIKANKDFELVVKPGMGHAAGNDEYDRRKRRDFFVKHLMGVTPPKWSEIYDTPTSDLTSRKNP